MTPRRAIIATRVFEPEGAAAAYRLGNLARSLDAAGFETKVLTTKAPGATRSTDRIRRWPVLRDKNGVVRGYLQYLSFDVPLFFRLLLSRRVDVVIAEPPPTTGMATRLACWVRRTPYFYYSADVTTAVVKKLGVHPLVLSAVSTMERLTLSGARGVLAISEDIRHEVVALGAERARVTVVGTGVDTSVFSPDGPRKTEKSPYFIYAGTMSEVHGASVFVDAFERVCREHPTVTLKMFGGGSELEAIKTRSRAFADRITFHDAVEAAEISAWLRGSTAILASLRPGQGYDFAFATKALAGLSCGVPVIYSGAGPLNELVTENHLGWATNWEATQVADAMLDALSTPRQHPDRRLSEWVEANYSLRSVADHAATAIALSLDQE